MAYANEPKSALRNYVFTINNPAEDLEKFDFSIYPIIRFVAFQREQGESGTQHFQGYVELTKTMRYTALKKAVCFFATAHMEVRKGSQSQAIDYCMKLDTRIEGPWEYGEKALQGKRNDILAAVEEIRAGKRERDIAEIFPVVYVKYHRGLSAYRRVMAKARDFTTELILLLGPTGYGKSHFAREFDPDACWKSRGEWFDNYDDEETIVFDDFYGWTPFDQLLRLADKYPLIVPTKGGFKNFRARYMFITANEGPYNWYKTISSSLMDAFIRRITTVIYFSGFKKYQEFHSWNSFLSNCSFSNSFLINNNSE